MCKSQTLEDVREVIIFKPLRAQRASYAEGRGGGRKSVRTHGDWQCAQGLQRFKPDGAPALTGDVGMSSHP